MCPSIHPESSLSEITDAIASFALVAPLDMDGRSSIFNSKPQFPQEHVQAFNTYTQSPSFNKDKLPHKPHYFEHRDSGNRHKIYQSDNSVKSSTSSSSSQNNSLSQSRVFFKIKVRLLVTLTLVNPTTLLSCRLAVIVV